MQTGSPDRAATFSVCVLIGMLAAACTPTGPPVDREAEKRASFTREEGPNARWSESEVVLPVYPREENLIEVQISGPRTFTFLVDTESVRSDDDGVVRYALIARSPAGAVNASYEGIRCDTAEYKTYAFGVANQTWSVVGGSEWNLIRKQQTNDYRYALFRFYFCPNGIQQTSSTRADRKSVV